MAINFSALFSIDTGDTVTNLGAVKRASEDARSAATSYAEEWGRVANSIQTSIKGITAAFSPIKGLDTQINNLANALSKLPTMQGGIFAGASAQVDALNRKVDEMAAKLASSKGGGKEKEDPEIASANRIKEIQEKNAGRQKELQMKLEAEAQKAEEKRHLQHLEHLEDEVNKASKHQVELVAQAEADARRIAAEKEQLEIAATALRKQKEAEYAQTLAANQQKYQATRERLIDKYASLEKQLVVTQESERITAEKTLNAEKEVALKELEAKYETMQKRIVTMAAESTKRIEADKEKSLAKVEALERTKLATIQAEAVAKASKIAAVKAKDLAKIEADERAKIAKLGKDALAAQARLTNQKEIDLKKIEASEKSAVARNAAFKDSLMVKAANQLTLGRERLAVQAEAGSRRSSGGGGLSNLLGVFMGGAALGQLKGLEDGIIAAKMRADEFRISLDALGLSTEKTAELYQNLRKYTNYGFELPELEKATVQFERLNLDIEKNVDLAARLAATSGKPITSAVNLLSKIGEKANLSGRMLQNQFNISPDMLQKEAGKEGGGSVVKDGKIILKTDEDVQALLRYVDAINLAQGGAKKLEEYQNSLRGSFSKLAANVEEAKVAIGDHMGPAVVGLNTLLSSLLEKFKGQDESSKSAVGTTVFAGGAFATFTTAIAPTIYTISALTRALQGLTVAEGAVALFGGGTAFAVAIVSVGTLIYQFSKLINMLQDGAGPVANFMDILEGVRGHKTRSDTANDDIVAQWTSKMDAYNQSMQRAIDLRSKLLPLSSGERVPDLEELRARDRNYSASDALGASRGFMSEAEHGVTAYANRNSGVGSLPITMLLKNLLQPLVDLDMPKLITIVGSLEKGLAEAKLAAAKGNLPDSTKRDLIGTTASVIELLREKEGVGSKASRVLVSADIEKLNETLAQLREEVESRKKVTDTFKDQGGFVGPLQSKGSAISKNNVAPKGFVGPWRDTTADIQEDWSKYTKGKASGAYTVQEENSALYGLWQRVKDRTDIEEEKLKIQKAYVDSLKEEYKFHVKATDDALKLQEVLKTGTPQSKVDAAEEKVRLSHVLAREERDATGNVSPEVKNMIHEAEIAAKGVAKVKHDIELENQTKLIEVTKGEYAAKTSELWKYEETLHQAGIQGVEFEKLIAYKKEQLAVEHEQKLVAVQRAAQDAKGNAQTARLHISEAKLAFQRDQGHGIDIGPGGTSINEDYRKSRHAVAEDQIDNINKERDRQLNDLSRKIRVEPDPVIRATYEAEKKQLQDYAKAKIEALRETLEETDKKEIDEIKKRADEDRLSELKLNVQKATFKSQTLKNKMSEIDYKANQDPNAKPGDIIDKKVGVEQEQQTALLEEFNTQMAVLKQERDIALQDEHKNSVEKGEIEKKYAEDVLELRQKMVDASKALTQEILKQKGLEDKSKTTPMGGIYKSYADISKAVDNNDSIESWKLKRQREEVEEKDKSVQNTIMSGGGPTSVADQLKDAAKRKTDQEAAVKKRKDYLDRYQWERTHTILEPFPADRMPNPVLKKGDKTSSDHLPGGQSGVGDPSKDPAFNARSNVAKAEVVITLVYPDGKRTSQTASVPLSSRISGQNTDTKTPAPSHG